MKKTLLSFALYFCSTTLFAWNDLGHKVIANIAYQNLQPAVRAKVDKMAADLTKEYPEIRNSFVEMAAWPDHIRHQSIDIYDHWHYINIPFSNDGTKLRKLADKNNVVWAINHIQQVLKNHQSNRYERARFLAFLAHCTGDIHQPLHTVALMTAKFPLGDKGGNLYLIKYKDYKNLHALWDNGLGVFDRPATPENVNALSKTIIEHYPQSRFKAELKNYRAKLWAKESYKIARNFAYTTPQNQTPSERYLKTGRQITEEQVALAGYRLASKLNFLLDPKHERKKPKRQHKKEFEE